MSTNKTTNYALHAWVKDDKFLMDEVNENFTALDTKLHEEVDVLDRLLKAETKARTEQMAAKADKTEVAAKADAATVTALQAALREKAQLYVGIYVGNGDTAGQSINLGFHPTAVLFSSELGPARSDLAYGGLVLRDLSLTSNSLRITETGFMATSGGIGSTNSKGLKYAYLALR